MDAEGPSLGRRNSATNICVNCATDRQGKLRSKAGYPHRSRARDPWCSCALGAIANAGSPTSRTRAGDGDHGNPSRAARCRPRGSESGQPSRSMVSSTPVTSLALSTSKTDHIRQPESSRSNSPDAARAACRQLEHEEAPDHAHARRSSKTRLQPRSVNRLSGGGYRLGTPAAATAAEPA
jgi:hypothetical protein